jgi:hypothetical protein
MATPNNTVKTSKKRQSPIARAEFDVKGYDNMILVIYKPYLDSARRTWGCRFKFTAPLDTEHTIFGENSLQSLILALKIAATTLYASDLYKNKKIGVFGEFGGRLIFPSPQSLLDIAPYPF